MKKFSTLVAINLLFSLFFSIFVGFKSFSFINSSFTIGMLYLLCGILCFVWEKGFFNIALFSFNKIAQQLQKRKGVLIDETSITIEDYANRENSFIYTVPLLSSGLIISSLTTLISFNIYF
ncbi:DUF3899 domain-containing protein [Romboutsia weinsteinii]|uniref:DUF3899 domain-containing protein n=1 Tax=Romboutsia weinsteinii TaxID=2020949 RepID=A0A371IYB0_9FIRM|nr:DUF3899 domain-containing protein [Romboutsia weinsteinii]RDY25459.1 DUF3899 domain-containing protein [Romboutsia weinsteinii]